MAEHLQQLLAIQRELVRAVSHELRTPVARLRFGLEMISTATTVQARDKYLEGMDHDIQDLDGLVDEMLTYARLEQGSPALNFQRVDLDALVNQVISELAPLRAEIRVQRGLCLSAADCDGAWVEAEPRYLHRALQNLVGNAMRHAQGQVAISYQVGQQRCRVDVEDDGPGVPESAWEKIFTPFCAWTTAAPELRGAWPGVVHRASDRALARRAGVDQQEQEPGRGLFQPELATQPGKTRALSPRKANQALILTRLSNCPSFTANCASSSLPLRHSLDRSVSRRRRTCPRSVHSSTSACSK